VTANRGYQQLRSHLAYLKLTAAAEGLPAELAHARDNDLSHTALLERLFGLEVDATAARRHAGRLRLAGFPAHPAALRRHLAHSRCGPYQRALPTLDRVEPVMSALRDERTLATMVPYVTDETNR